MASIQVRRWAITTVITVVLCWLAAPAASAAGDPVIVAAGDIASCLSGGDEATAALVAGVPGATVITTGDNAYWGGTLDQYLNCYGPTWGLFKDRTRPSAGNHEYRTSGAAGYFGYFGAAAGEPGKGYYSFDLGTWHLIALNSNCSDIGGCGAGSAEEQWLRADLAAHPTACTLAYWHHPLFNSGEHGSTAEMRPIWQALYEAGVDVVLNGHSHDYEAFAPQNPSGVADARGIREFVVGTGGRSHAPFGAVDANSLVRNNDTFGVLAMTLSATSYSWQFLPEAGKTFTDNGAANCI